MQAIETQDKQFHDGNGTTELGTILPAWWLNQIQAELLAVLTAAKIAPNKAKTNQLAQAIQTLFPNKNFTLTAGAGLTGGGDLSANRTIALATPSTLSGSTKNRVGSGTTGHTHEIAKATPALAGVVRLVNNLTSGGTDAALSAEQGKLLAGRVGNISETKLGNRGSQTLNGALTVGNPNEWNKLIFPTDNGRWIFEANPKSSLGTPDSVRVNLRYVEGNQSRYISWPHVANREVVAYRSWVSSNTADAVKRATAPAGTVMYFAGQAAPNGWLKANGAAVSRTVYADLYAAIGTTYGEGDGSTTFNLPDLRGEFVRGFDDGRQVDSGRALGTWQKPTLATLEAQDLSAVIGVGVTKHGRDYAETVEYFGGDAVQNVGDYPNVRHIYSMRSGSTDLSTEVLPSGHYAAAVRPRNIALLACIKI